MCPYLSTGREHVLLYGPGQKKSEADVGRLSNDSQSVSKEISAKVATVVRAFKFPLR